MVGAMPDAIAGFQHYPGKIFDKYEVASGFSHKTSFPVAQPLVENGQRTSHIPGTDNICEAKRHVIESGNLQIIFVGSFRNCVTAASWKLRVI